MTFSLYQSLRTVPVELIEAARMYHLSPWQRFWRLEVPHGVPPLIWNMMMSVSAGWFFVVASEAITVSGQTILLPGVGSYIATAIAERDLAAIGYALLIMLIVILLYDQLIQDLVQAARAIEESDIELRSKMLNHAILVIAHLQSALDFTAGGKVAQNLDLFYNTLRTSSSAKSQATRDERRLRVDPARRHSLSGSERLRPQSDGSGRNRA